MKTNLTFPATILLSLSTYLAQPLAALAQGTAFTYQGRLNDSDGPANGTYDLRFALLDAVSGGSQQGGTLTNSPTFVSNGLFTVTLDFGNQFPGATRWLEIAVRTNGGASFTVLSPRQRLVATPYAITASNLTGMVSASGLSGTYSSSVTFNNAGNSFSGNGAGLNNVNAGSLGGLASSNFWKTVGNAGANPTNGAFLGTTDNLPLEIKVSGQRALRIESGSGGPNLIGGSSHNFVGAGVSGAFIGGGGRTSLYTNRTASSWSVIGGGIDNSIETNATYAFIGSGDRNTIQDGSSSAIVGGQQNTMTNAIASFIGAGYSCDIDGDYCVIGGGLFNRTIAQSHGFIGGGAVNKLGGTNQLGTAGGTNFSNVIVGGMVNWIASGATASFIGGGRRNFVTNGANFATIPGGRENVAGGDYSFASGRRARALHDGTFVWADSIDSDFSSSGTNQFLVRASGGVGINVTNPADALHIQSDSGVRTRTTTTGTGFAGFLSKNSLGEWFAGVAPGTNHWYLFENEPSAAARLVVKSGGNVGIGTSVPTNKLHVAGGVSATAFVNTSDRNAKENFTPVSPQEILSKVAALPISTWNFKTMNDGRHMGPTAQDFHAAFGLGGGDTTITSIDPDGVALAAIQGLHHKLEAKEVEIADLKSRLEKLERLTRSLVKN